MNMRAYEREPAQTCEVVEVDAGAVARVDAAISDARRRKSACDIHGAMADPTRHAILEALACEPMCVCDIAAVAAVSQSAASHQLRVLRDLDLVTFEREGKRAVYRLSDDHVRMMLTTGLEHAAERGGMS
jgi:DNA-binding transcriptional ArsR family regulator